MMTVPIGDHAYRDAAYTRAPPKLLARACRRDPASPRARSSDRGPRIWNGLAQRKQLRLRASAAPVRAMTRAAPSPLELCRAPAASALSDPAEAAPRRWLVDAHSVPQ